MPTAAGLAGRPSAGPDERHEGRARFEVSDREVIRGFVAWGPAALWAAVLFLLSARSDVPSASWLPWGDKIGHFGLYAVLGGALAWARIRSRWEARHGWVLAVGVLYALGDEWHQTFVPGRDASLGDLAADVLGLFVGYLVSFLLLTGRAERGGAVASPPVR